jgi:hypothetical protein
MAKEFRDRFFRIFSSAAGGVMGVVVIPFGYETLPPSSQAGIIPICIETVDRYGNEIAPVWFEDGVAPLHERIVRIAQFRLGDAWLASELAQTSLHKLWYSHGSNAGDCPSAQVWSQILWDVRDFEFGGDWRIRRCRLVLRTLEELDRQLSAGTVYRQKSADDYERRLLLQYIEVSLAENGLEEIARIYRLVLLGNTWAEIADGLGYGTAESLKKKFHRAIRRIFMQAPENTSPMRVSRAIMNGDPDGRIARAKVESRPKETAAGGPDLVSEPESRRLPRSG